MLSVRFIMLFFCLAAAAAQDTIQKHLVAKIEGLVDGDAFLMKTRPLTLALELLDAPAPGSLAVEVYRTTGEIETRSVEGHEACARVVYGDQVEQRCVSIAEAQSTTVYTLTGDKPGKYVITCWIGSADGSNDASNLEARVLGRGDELAAKNVLGLWLGHDASAALVIDGRVERVIEFERFFEVRFFGLLCESATRGEDLERVLREALREHVVDHVSWVPMWPVDDACKSELRRAVSKANHDVAPTWVEVDHHASHATLVMHDAPFSNPLMLSFDGGGNDGVGFVYERANDTLRTLEKIEYNFGASYAKLGVFLEEVSGGIDAYRRRCANRDYSTILRCALGLAGKVMGYAGLGRVRDEWLEYARHFMKYSDGLIRIAPMERIDEPWLGRDEWGEPWERGITRDDVWKHLPVDDASNATTLDRDWAATAQRAFELEVRALLEPYFLTGAPYDGLAMTGGCALNVIANSYLERVFAVNVYAPPHPGDGGLSVGAAWQLRRPPSREPLQHAGPALFDLDALEAHIDAFSENHTENVRVRRLDEDALIEAVADALAGGAIIGVARSRTEFGPRALGRRSLLAVPVVGARHAMNVVKFREWWRPCAPVVAVEDALRVFTTLPRSPYMSFAPRLTAAAAAALPDIVHFDGTARPQTVAPTDDAWLHKLLLAVKARTGWAVLINTSFNARGKPILNTAREALALPRDSPAMSAVVFDDRVVELPDRPRALAPDRSCADDVPAASPSLRGTANK